MSPSDLYRLDRFQIALQSLEGLAMGDAYGNHHGNNPRKRAADQWNFSDDTIMAASIVANLGQHGKINQMALAHSFATHWDGQRGYGRGVTQLLKQIQQGAEWKSASSAMFGSGSYGNGAAMRVSPLGAYCYDNFDMAVEQARLSAEVTHMHPEGIAGAIAVAVGAALAYRYRQAKLPSLDFLGAIIDHVPESDVRNKIIQATEMPPHTSVSEAAKLLGNGRPAIAQTTLGFALWMAARHSDDFEMAITQTASAMGDVDTNCAIVGGIVVLSTGFDSIPTGWLKRRETLPLWAIASEG
jgi:ADP-ribosylglycohydrolase